MNVKLKYLLLCLTTFILCVIIVLIFSSHGFIRGFLGDLVIVILLFSLVKTFYLFSNLKLAIAVVLFAYLIEFTQYIKIIPLLGFKENFITKIIFGSIFDPFDLLAYTLGGIISYFIGNQLESTKEE